MTFLLNFKVTYLAMWLYILMLFYISQLWLHIISSLYFIMRVYISQLTFNLEIASLYLAISFSQHNLTLYLTMWLYILQLWLSQIFHFTLHSDFTFCFEIDFVHWLCTLQYLIHIISTSYVPMWLYLLQLWPWICVFISCKCAFISCKFFFHIISTSQCDFISYNFIISILYLTRL